MRSQQKLIPALALMALGFDLSACSSKKPEEPIVQTYHVAYRQFPPEPVYSRLMWSNLPQPIMPKSKENAPLIMPILAFELPKSNLEEAIQALAQTIGYNWTYPPEAARRPIAIKMTAPADEILQEISRQAKVSATFDHDSRMVRVFAGNTIEGRPAAKLPGS